MSRLDLYKCELCLGSKPGHIVYGVKGSHKIELVIAEEGDRHICKECTTAIRSDLASVAAVFKGKRPGEFVDIRKIGITGDTCPQND